MLEPVICSNRDCEIFYRRAKAGLQIKLVCNAFATFFRDHIQKLRLERTLEP